MTQLYRYPTELKSETVCTVGNFDGVHLGHQHLISEMSKVELPKVIVSFYPHPIEVLRPDVRIASITSLRTELSILRSLGVEYLYLVHFTKKLSELSPKEFLDEILSEKLHCKHLVAGPDLRIGKDRAGTPEVLAHEAKERGWGFQVVEPLLLPEKEEKLGSRDIRIELEKGDVKRAGELLGRSFVLSGKVVHGDKRGREIGFPTANIHIPHSFILAKGVYAGIANVMGEEFPAAINIGVRPTFSGSFGALKVEAHFIGVKDFDCYGARCELSFVDRIREERAFKSVDELKKQIFLDLESAKKML